MTQKEIKRRQQIQEQLERLDSMDWSQAGCLCGHDRYKHQVKVQIPAGQMLKMAQLLYRFWMQKELLKDEDNGKD